MKKQLMSIMVIGIAAIMLGAGTFAYFSDTETSTGSTFQAGTIDLAVNGENPWASAMFTFTDVKPCEDLEPFSINITNVGQNPGILSFIADYVENDKECDDDPANFEFAANAQDEGHNTQPATGQPQYEMTANHFAKLVYIKAATCQYGHEGYTGSVKNDLPDMVTDMDTNGDDLVSVYEYKAHGPVPYDPVNDPFIAGAWINYTITLHLGHAFISGTDQIDITQVPWNRPQADGIDITFTATLTQVML